MHNRQVLTFDTSAHNRLMKGGLESEAVLAALKAGYFVRLAGVSLEELMATPDADVRSGLMTTAGRMLQGPSDCLFPQNETLRLLISAYEAHPQTFQWLSVDVRAPEYTHELIRREFSGDDALAAEQKRHMTEMRKQFETVWAEIRPVAEDIFQRGGEPRPRRFQDVISHAVAEDGLYWKVAKGLYDHAAKVSASEAAIRHFVKVCPPFRCAVYGLAMAWYDRSLRDYNGGEKFHAGRNDLFMAIYLPYCDRFISDEKKREQIRCLAEIARVAEVKAVVQSYDDFCSGLMIPALA